MNRKWMSILLSVVMAAGLFGVLPAPRALAATTYYSQGSLAPNLTTSWNTNEGGGGIAPSNFTTAIQTFVIQNGHNMTTTAAWSISGSSTKLQIKNGGTLTANDAVTLASGTTFQIDAGGTYVHNNTTAYGSSIFQGTEVFDAASTVILNNSNTTGPSSVAFGNLTVNFTSDPGSVVNCSGGVISIQGDLTVTSTSTREFRLTGVTSLTLNLGGNLNVSGGTLDLASGAGAPTINIGGNFSLTGGTFTSSGSTSTVVFTGGTSSVTFTKSAGTLTNTRINWQVASGKTVTMNNDLDVATSRTLTVNGTLNTGTNLVTGFGAFTLASGATLGIGSADGITSSGATGNIQTTTRNFNTGANYTYNCNCDSSNQMMGDAIPASVNNLTINYSRYGYVVPQSNVTVNGTLALTNGGLNNSDSFNVALATGTKISVVAGRIVAPPDFAGTVNVEYIGTAGHWTGNELPTGAAVLNDLTINDTGGVILDSSALTVNGTLTIGTGANLDAYSRDITLKGNWTNNGTFTPRARTVTCSGSSAQTIGGTATSQTFNNLTLSNTSGGVSVGGSTVTMTLNGNLNITTGGFTAPSGNLTVGGNWTNSGTFTHNSGTVIFSKSGTSTYGGSSTTTFNSLTVNAGTTLDVGTNALFGAAGTVTNNGTMQQTKMVPSGTVSFLTIGSAYFGVDITPTGSSLDSTTVSIQGNQVCTSPQANGTPVKRCYGIAVGSAQPANIKFYFIGSEMQSGQSLSSLNVWHYHSTPTPGWDQITKGVTGGAAGCDSYSSAAKDCYVTGTGIISYSPFTLKNGDPLAAPLASLDATAVGGRIVVAWETTSELGSQGYHLYRAAAAGGGWTRLNAAMIASQAPGSPSGYGYRWNDAGVTRGVTYRYRVAAVELDGREEALETVSVTTPYWLWLPAVTR